MAGYAIYTLVFSPATIISPAVLVYVDKYVSSDFIWVHIFLVILNIIFFLIIYEEITFMGTKLIIKKVGLFAWRLKEVDVRSIDRWEPGNPHKIFLVSGELVLLSWFALSREDQKYLYTFLDENVSK